MQRLNQKKQVIDGLRDRLASKTAETMQSQGSKPPVTSPTCTSGTLDTRPPTPPVPGGCPATEYATCSCAYNGTVPRNRDAPLLFNLTADPRETTNLAASAAHAAALRELRADLDAYIASAVTPLNALPAERQQPPEASPGYWNRTFWAPWNTTGRRDEL